jgi:hypothetical protein
MRHVDEGTLHAWLEGQLDDPVDAARIDDHVRHCDLCRTNADRARATIVEVEQLLACTMPAAPRPAFTELVASGPAGAGSVSPESRRTVRRWMTAAAWAASVTVAAGLGWIARNAHAPVSQQEPAPFGVVPVKAPSMVTAAPRQEDSAVPPPTVGRHAENRVSSNANSVTPAPAARSTSESPPSTLRPRLNRSSSMLATEMPRAVARESAVLPPIPADFLANRPDVPANGSTFEAAPVVDARKQGLEYPYPFRGSFPTGLAGGSVQTASGNRQAMQGRITVDGRATAERALARQYTVRPFVRTSGEWRSLPRTAAAVQSGMALRGIDGMVPSSTMLSADNTVVRTLYQIQPGQTLEIWQGSGVGALTNAPADRRSLTPFPWQEGWSMAVEDVLLLLKGAAGPERLSEFANRLRVD